MKNFDIFLTLAAMSKRFIHLHMAKRKSAGVSMDPNFKQLAEQRAENLGLNFSAYVNQLIRADLQRGNQPLQVAEHPSMPYGSNKGKK